MFDIESLRRFSRLLLEASIVMRDVAETLERRPLPELSAIDMGLQESGLSVRSRKLCNYARVRSLRELATKTADELSAIKCCGKHTIAEIRAELAKHGLALQGDQVRCDHCGVLHAKGGSHVCERKLD